MHVKGFLSLILFLFICTLAPLMGAVNKPAVVPAVSPAPPVVRLAMNGKALLPVVISEKASEQVKKSAQALADMLKKISGATFEVKTGDGTAGLAVGVFTDFPTVNTRIPFDAVDSKNRETYLLRSHAKGIYLIGATELAVQDAVWDFLYRLGYRQFFPNPDWEVAPHLITPSIALNDMQTPDYYSRLIWYGYGSYPENMKQYTEWCAKNRALPGIALNTGHAYDGFIRANKAAFAAHPEYYALVNGKRDGSKLCIANPDLRKLVVDTALKQLADNPTLDSISVEPSDGGGWCECEQCKAMGSIPDRALTLANEVAQAVNKQFPGKLVGMYAYNEHCAPPTITVDPHVIVSVATAFIRGYSVDQLIDGWHERGATEGIREYYAINVWERDLPGGPRGAKLDYLQQTIPHFYQRGARFMSAESGDSWGPCGLGFYFASRMLWDVDEARRRDAILNDFFERAFGPAKKSVMEFYKLLDGSTPKLMSDDLIGRMYRHLRDAKTLAKDPGVLARIDDLILYTHYVDLYWAYASTAGEPHQQAFEQLFHFAYRIRSTGMIHTLALVRDLPNRDKSVKVPPDCEWSVPDAKNPWKQDPPIYQQDVDKFLADGIRQNTLVDFTPVTYSTNLAPVTRLNLPKVADSMPLINSRFDIPVYTWVPEGQGKVNISYTGYGRDFSLVSAQRKVGALEDKDLRKSEVIPPDKPQQLELKTPNAGLHILTIGGSTTGWISFRLLDDLPMTVSSDNQFSGRWYLYFYVPKGTKVIGGYTESKTGNLINPDGKEAFAFEKMNRIGYFSVPVPAGQDGKLWKMNFNSGRKILMTVPPYYARNAAELLLPVEVVNADAQKN